MNNLLFIHALSPLHAGTGQGIGVIDLPIAREKASNLPYLPGSSIKGVLRDQWNDFNVAETEKDRLKKEQTILFGPETSNAADNTGAVNIGDAKLLLLPIRSLKGTFAWVTSPYLLERFARDRALIHKNPNPPHKNPNLPQLRVDGTNCLVFTDNAITHKGHVYLEDLDITHKVDQSLKEWVEALESYLFKNDPVWSDFLKKRLCVVSDDILGFLAETATEVTARIRLEDETKTVTKGGLWYEESLPAESVLYSIVVSQRSFVKNSTANAEGIVKILKAKLGTEAHLQFGGKATVGRGLCRVVMV